MHCLYSAKAVPKNGAPSSNADKAAFRRLPENVLPQWQQVLDLHIFRQKQPGHWAEVVCHFHLLIIIYSQILENKNLDPVVFFWAPHLHLSISFFYLPREIRDQFVKIRV